MKKITLLNLIFLCVFGIADAQNCTGPFCNTANWYTCAGFQVDMNANCTFTTPDILQTQQGTCTDLAAAIVCYGPGTYSFEQNPEAGVDLAATHDVPVNFVVRLIQGMNGPVLDSLCVTITPQDVTPPTLTCPDPSEITLSLDQACMYTIPDYTGITTTDCTEPVVVTQSVAAGPYTGSHGDIVNIDIIGIDDAGNRDTCEVTITVEDQSAPNITALPNITVNTNGMSGGDPACFAVVVGAGPQFEGINGEDFIITPDVQDNCPANVTTTYTITFQDDPPATGTIPIPGSIQFPLGIHTIEYCADDGGLADPTCISFTVNVRDGIAPEFDDCPNNSVDVFLDSDGNYNTEDLALTGSDNCTNINADDFDYSPANFGCADLGGKTVIVTLNDDSFESIAATCVVNVVVRDTVNPTCITVTGNFTVELDDDGNGTLTSADRLNIETQYNNSSESDNCPGDISIMAGTVTCDDLGTAMLELTVNDNHEMNDPNITICTVEVTVEDNAPPTGLVCPDDESHPSDQSCTATISIPIVTATDNCGDVTFEFSFFNGMTTITGTPGDMATFPTGETQVTYTATDAAGNSIMCDDYDVTVTDGSAPTAICVEFLQVSLVGENVTVLAEDLDNGSTDPCPNTNFIFEVNGEEEITISCDDVNGAPDTLFFVLDVFDSQGGNTDNCTASVVVLDVTPPTCPAITPQISKAPGETVSQGDLEGLDPQVSDNCGVSVIQIVEHSPFSCEISDTVITYNVIDDAGNQIPCPLTVNIMDSDPPEINGCPPGITQIILDADGNATISAEQFGITAMDNCIASEDLVIELDITELDCDDLGEVLITASVTAGGQTDECTFTIDVVDVTMPTFECAAELTLNITSGGVYILDEEDIRNMIANPSDACSDFADWEVSATPNTYDCGDVGTNNVVITVADESGNERNLNCTFELEGVAEVNIIGPDGICEGNAFDLTENSMNLDNPNIEWEWSGPGVGAGENMSTLEIEMAAQIHENPFTVIVTAENGCTAEASFSDIQVWALPLAGFTLFDDLIQPGDKQFYTNTSNIGEANSTIDSRILCFTPPSEDFGDDEPLPEIGNICDTWNDETEVKVLLKIEDSNGCKDEACEEFRVGDLCNVELDDNRFDNDNHLILCESQSTIMDLNFEVLVVKAF